MKEGEGEGKGKWKGKLLLESLGLLLAIPLPAPKWSSLEFDRRQYLVLFFPPLGNAGGRVRAREHFDPTPHDEQIRVRIRETPSSALLVRKSICADW